MTLEYACIAPHGGDLIPHLASRSSEKKFRATREGIRRLAREIAAARPRTIIIATPHNLRLLGRIGIVISENSSGSLRGPSGKSVSLSVKCNTNFARKLLTAASSIGLPAVGANYGTSEGPASNMPMDWGTLVPLWFPLKEHHLRARIVIVTPSREIPLSQNFRMGKLIAKLANKEKERIVFVASADQAHAHLKTGPYGFSEAAPKYDRLVCKAIEENNLTSIMRLDANFVERAKPDSLWQMTVLAGILDEVPMKSGLVLYDVPTYYGMVCASFHRVH